MAIVKFNTINQAETEMIKKYLSQGLELDVNAMSGTQGERGKVALADDKNVYFIYIDHSNIGEDFLTSHYGLKLIVERHDRDKRDLIDNWHTYWLGKGEIIEQIIYHELPESKRGGKAYTTDESEYQSIHDKHWQRAENRDRWDSWKKVNYNLDTIIEIVKNKSGRKRVAQENIIGVEKRYDGNYWRINVMFNGKKSCIGIN